MHRPILAIDTKLAQSSDMEETPQLILSKQKLTSLRNEYMSPGLDIHTFEARVEEAIAQYDKAVFTRKN